MGLVIKSQHDCSDTSAGIKLQCTACHFFISTIDTAYSRKQKKPVHVCRYVRTLIVPFLFQRNWHRHKNANSKNEWKYGRFAHAQWKMCNITFIYDRTADVFANKRKSGSRNTMLTSDLRPEVEVWPLRACAMKNMQYNRWNSSVIVDWLWGGYHVTQNVFLVSSCFCFITWTFLSWRRVLAERRNCTSWVV